MDKSEFLLDYLPCREDIDYVFLFEGYTIIVNKNGSNEVVDLPMTRVEEMLKDRSFFRIHRSYLVNLRRITEMEIKNKQLLIRMRGHALPVSRRKKKKLLDLLGAVN